MRAVILAGGRGKRLMPYTTVLPKPLIPVGEMPILEILIRQLKSFGLERITLSVGYLGPLIVAYFGDGASYGVSIEYSQERDPLGTAGPLSLVSGLDETFVVMNGDLLTDVDFGQLIECHRQSGALLTVGVSARETRIDFGVLQITEDHRIHAYIEKPVQRYLVSMGLYVFEPKVLKYIPKAQRLDLPDVVNALLRDDQPVASYLHEGYWMDIGRLEDCEAVQKSSDELLRRLLGL
jgi:NDP-sugar pyrophosphorylase family protein